MKKKNGLHIKIACEGAALVELDDLIPFQGELKSLSKENYQRLRQEIIDTGVGFPFRVWRDAGKFFLIGGHQTKLVLTQMRDEEGFSLGRVPVSFTEARDYEEAKRRVLQDITQYGKVERQGLYQFLNESKISFDELQKRFDVPGIDIKKFHAEYFKDLDSVFGSKNEDELYNNKIEAPVYTPKGDKPLIKDLVDFKKTQQLIEQLATKKNLSPEERNFLTYAAYRHSVFNYETIAEYYAHATPEVQDLMERSALVIIDFNKAIENGFTVLTEKIAESYKSNVQTS